MSSHNDDLHHYLSKEIDARTHALWVDIKALPTTNFPNNDDSLKAIVEIGKRAERIQKLWEARRVL